MCVVLAQLLSKSGVFHSMMTKCRTLARFGVKVLNESVLTNAARSTCNRLDVPFLKRCKGRRLLQTEHSGGEI